MRLWKHENRIFWDISDRIEAAFEWAFMPSYGFYIHRENGNDYDIVLHLALGLNIWFSLRHPWLARKDDDYRTFGLELGGDCERINWKLWMPIHEWTSSTPYWRDGIFNFKDFFLGIEQHNNSVINSYDQIFVFRDVRYPVRVNLISCEKNRARFPVFKRTYPAVEIESEKGIPHHGKWGDDRTYRAWYSDIKSPEVALLQLKERLERAHREY